MITVGYFSGGPILAAWADMRFQSKAMEAAVMAEIFINDRLETDVSSMATLPSIFWNQFNSKNPCMR
jgi:hypothetical protein